DDHPMMRQGLAQLINNEPDLTVCAEADTAGQALELLNKARPGLWLIDISLPDKNGIELIKDIRAMDPASRILVVSMHDESLYAERILRAGARGYIMKQEGGKKLMEAIRHVLAGNIYVSEKMSGKILEIFSGQRDTGGSPVARLTDREFEVFQLIGEGKGTRQIAEHLHLSVKTVEVHRANIKEKLGLKTATDLVRYAVRWTESQTGV
ncbi:MAG TPA: response regulator transcription factor, partial [Verrucomicrobiota bacterium]|nr:response regulator transcription factor [Verrucomicrobiota bacterium]